MSKFELLSESNFQDVEVLSEQDESGKKSWYLEGVFIQSDVVNRNRRVYPDPIVEKEVSRYVNEYVKTKRAVGELSHPPTPEINLNNISHIIESIEKQGTNYLGKAKILNTPSGRTAEGLLEGGVKLGVSSRGMGSVKKNREGISEVQENFKLATVDIVYQPSAPDAFVEGLMENSSFIWNTTEEDKEYLESIKEHVHKTNKRHLEEVKLALFEEFLDKISKTYN